MPLIIHIKQSIFIHFKQFHVMLTIIITQQRKSLLSGAVSSLFSLLLSLPCLVLNWQLCTYSQICLCLFRTGTFIFFLFCLVLITHQRLNCGRIINWTQTNMFITDAETYRFKGNRP